MIKVEEYIRGYVQKCNHKKYWELRAKLLNTEKEYPKILKLLWLYKIKRMDAFNNSSMRTELSTGDSLKKYQIFHTVCMELLFRKRYLSGQIV